MRARLGVSRRGQKPEASGGGCAGAQGCPRSGKAGGAQLESLGDWAQVRSPRGTETESRRWFGEGAVGFVEWRSRTCEVSQRWTSQRGRRERGSGARKRRGFCFFNSSSGGNSKRH